MGIFGIQNRRLIGVYSVFKYRRFFGNVSSEYATFTAFQGYGVGQGYFVVFGDGFVDVPGVGIIAQNDGVKIVTFIVAVGDGFGFGVIGAFQSHSGFFANFFRQCEGIGNVLFVNDEINVITHSIHHPAAGAQEIDDFVGNAVKGIAQIACFTAITGFGDFGIVVAVFSDPITEFFAIGVNRIVFIFIYTIGNSNQIIFVKDIIL